MTLERLSWLLLGLLVLALPVHLWLGPKSRVSEETLAQDQSNRNLLQILADGGDPTRHYDPQTGAVQYTKVTINKEKLARKQQAAAEARAGGGQPGAATGGGGPSGAGGGDASGGSGGSRDGGFIVDLREPDVYHEQFLPGSLVEKYSHKQDAVDLSMHAASRWVDLPDGTQGRELYNLEDRSPLRSNLGLQDGDVVISVNSVPVDQLQDKQQAWDFYDQFKHQSHHIILIRRGNQTIQKDYYVSR